MRLLREIDPLFLAAALVLALLGITMIYSAAFHSESAVIRTAWEKQALYAIAALLLSLGAIVVPNRILNGLSYPIYLASLFPLLAVLFWGSGEDAARWLDLGPVRLQPSEFVKLTTIIALARYLSDRSSEEINHVRSFLVAASISLLPMALVVRQPDLGTSLTYGAPLLPMLYWAGMQRIFLFFIVSPLLSVIFSFEPLWQKATPFIFAAFIVASTVGFHLFLSRVWFTVALTSLNLTAGMISIIMWDHFLLPYQKDRILIFLEPQSDRLGAGWNIIQSKIAIGSGGLTGKGFLEGTQTKYEFLPAAHTDFIFAVIGEELGFIGTIVVLALFFFLAFRAVQIAAMAKNRFYSLIAIGLASLLTFHVFVNIGMTMGVMPVAGLPLPFLSYGGSSLMTNFVAIGLLLHVFIYRHEY
jgi:rod shape determining protein RodA